VTERRSGHGAALWILFGLFVGRVVAQLSIPLGGGSFLPPWEEWFSGALGYRPLLASQIVIILLYGKIALDVSRGRGFFAVPRRRLGSALLVIGSVYFGVMVIRYAIRMTLYPHERWTGGSIPIFFHWVLAAFLLVLAHYHRSRAAAPAPARHPIRTRLTQAAMWTAIAVGVAIWAMYQVAPALLTRVFNVRRPEYAVRIDRGVAFTTSDGITLVADVYRPVRGGATTPTILVRVPLSKTIINALFATVVGRFWAEHGYTVVIQGTRGRYGSSGDPYPLRDERRDGLETLDWLKRQPWFDGRIGMWGGSAFGHTQWAIADALPSRPSGRSTMMVQIASNDFHGMFYQGGAFALASALFWAVRSRGPNDEIPDPATLARGYDGFPLIEADDRAAGDIPFFNDWVRHVDRDDYWRAIDDQTRAVRIQGPVLLTAGWFDPFLPGQLADFVRIRREARAEAAGPTRLIVGPYQHAETVMLPGNVWERNYRLASLGPTVPWFDRYLRELPYYRSPGAPVRLYVMGTNTWRDEQEWPLGRAVSTSWHLRSGGHANSSTGDGRLTLEAPGPDEPADRFDADPQHAVPTAGGAFLGFGAGVQRQNDIEQRRDVLVYTTAPLVSDLEVTGDVSVVLHVETSAPSTDFTAKLVDVHSNGDAYNVTDGILRATYRQDTPVAIEVSLPPTSMVFKQGHRIRLEIASSNFPRFDRNLNTGADLRTSTTAVVARQTVHHSAAAPSRLVLPVVPRR
jgi:putative CocE/NonD family hydrolase